MKRMIALLLALVMVFGMVACGAQQSADEPQKPAADQPAADQPAKDDAAEEPAATEGKDLSWLHPNAEPMVDEGVEKTLSIWFEARADVTDPEERYAYKYIEEVMNINLEVTPFLAANRDEFLSLAFASNDLPDLIICNPGTAFTPAELVKYGSQEKQLVDIAPYITEELMPNLTRIYEQRPDYRAAITASDGGIYALGMISDVYSDATINRTWYNYTWLEENGFAMPETLDELTEVLRAAKASGDFEYPLGGSWSSGNPMFFILNAFGYIYAANSGDGLKMAMRDGKPVLPVADREAYGEYLKYMNMLYEEGLIHPDFFTVDAETTKALAREGEFLLTKHMPSSYYDEDTMHDYWGARPLSSQWQTEPELGIMIGSIGTGGAAITSACEDVELACAFLDYFYQQSDSCLDSNAYRLDYGPVAGDPLADMFPEEELRIYENNTMTRKSFGEYGNEWDYCCNKIGLWLINSFGTMMATDFSRTTQNVAWEVVAEQYGEGAENRANWPAGLYNRASLRDVGYEFYTDEVFPAIVFLDEETQARANELKLVIDEYAETETAKFITGRRSLDELDDYFDEIEKLGAAEYVQIYTDYYYSK